MAQRVHRHEPQPSNRAPDRVKILLVDDTPENLISLEAALEGLGQELVLANSGMEALRHLLEDDFAAILLDVKMPEMDGFQTAELIRSRKRSRHTPILFLTGYKSDEHLFRGYDLGAVDFLFKPIVPEILRSKVSVFVELSRNTALLRRQAEVLSKAEQKFRSLLEAAPGRHDHQLRGWPHQPGEFASGGDVRIPPRGTDRPEHSDAGSGLERHSRRYRVGFHAVPRPAQFAEGTLGASARTSNDFRSKSA